MVVGQDCNLPASYHVFDLGSHIPVVSVTDLKHRNLRHQQADAIGTIPFLLYLCVTPGRRLLNRHTLNGCFRLASFDSGAVFFLLSGQRPAPTSFRM